MRNPIIAQLWQFKHDKTIKQQLLQVQKSKGQTTQNIKSAKGRKPNIAGAKRPLPFLHLQYLVYDLLHS